MTNKPLNVFILSALLALVSPVLGADHDKIYARPAKPPLLSRPSNPPKPPPQTSKPSHNSPSHNPFEKKFARRDENKRTQTPYPQTFNAAQIQLIVNTPLRNITSARGGTSEKREAVEIQDRTLGKITVSVKAPNATLNSIKAAIDARVLNGEVEKLTVFDATSITVHPDVRAQLHHVKQASYFGGTSQEEQKKTGIKKQGSLVEYILMKGNTPIQYLSPSCMSRDGLEKYEALLTLSVTTTPKKV